MNLEQVRLYFDFILFLSYYLSYQACISLFSVVIKEQEDTFIIVFLYIYSFPSFLSILIPIVFLPTSLSNRV